MSDIQRCILNDNDLAKFLVSSAKNDLVKFTSAMGKSCASSETVFKYNPHSPLIGLSPSLASLHGSLQAMLTWIDDFPPVDRSLARFGNPAFKQWHTRLLERSVSITHNILKTNNTNSGSEGEYDEHVLIEASIEGYRAAGITMSVDSLECIEDRNIVTELVSYLQPAFGHEVRLDYGTGHECSFQVFLLALCKIGCFGATLEETPSVTRLKSSTLSLWTAYLKITRQLQVQYMLEPAGSHGVWGLDDYHCLPFFFGACQMQVDGEDYTPTSIHDESALKRDSDNLMYFGCIQFIKSLKKGVPFFESSPMLNDISNLPNWSKVATGLLRLFEGEVLSKRQVVQHFVFGKIFKADWTPSQDPRKAPIGTFREGLSSGSIPVTKAPWAK